LDMPSKQTRPNPNPATDLVPCGLPRRVLIMLYDALIVLALMMLATGLLLIFNSQRLTAGKDIAYTLYLVAVWFTYLVWCWRSGGMTVGMRSWGVKLVSDDSPSLPWSACAIRFFVSLASALPMGAGFFWALSDPARRTWHDRASRSRLVRVQAN